MPNLHVIIPMDFDGPSTRDLPPVNFHWRMWAAPKNYLTKIDWMLNYIKFFAIVQAHWKRGKSFCFHLCSWRVVLSICQNPKPYNFGYDLAYDIVKHFVFNLLVVCVGPDVLTRYYLQMFTIYTVLVLKFKIHTRTCRCGQLNWAQFNC